MKLKISRRQYLIFGLILMISGFGYITYALGWDIALALFAIIWSVNIDHSTHT